MANINDDIIVNVEVEKPDITIELGIDNPSIELNEEDAKVLGVSGVVRYDTEQTLTSEEKSRARANIGANEIIPQTTTENQVLTSTSTAGTTQWTDTKQVTKSKLKTINNTSLFGEGNIEISGDKTYVFEQGVASSQWEITHNLGKYPSVSVVDSAGSMVIGEEEYVNANKVIVRFNGAFSGKAFLN